MKNIIMVALCLSITMATWVRGSTLTPSCGEDLAIPSGKSLSIPSVDHITEGVDALSFIPYTDNIDYDDIVYSRENFGSRKKSLGEGASKGKSY